MSNQVIGRKPNGQFAKGSSGNLGGNAQHTRHTFNKAFIRAFAADFDREGARTIARLRRESPVNYVKIAAFLVSRHMQVEHSSGVKGMTDEQLEQACAALREMLEKRAAGLDAKLVDVTPPQRRIAGSATERDTA